MGELYRDAAASPAARAEDLLRRMTLDEKVAQLGALWVNQLVVDDRFDADVAAERLARGIGQVTRIGASTGLRADRSAALVRDVEQLARELLTCAVEQLRDPAAGATYAARAAARYARNGRRKVAADLLDWVVGVLPVGDARRDDLATTAVDYRRSQR